MCDFRPNSMKNAEIDAGFKWYGCTCIKWLNAITFVDNDAEATSQMQEFAARTHQHGVPKLAKDYKPAIIDQAAMPIRVENG